MSFFSDAEIIRLVAARPRRLLTILDRAQSMWPWVVVLAIIPGLYAIAQRELTEADAFWGERALVLSAEGAIPNAEDLMHVTGYPPQMSTQPPLGTYLTAWAMRLMGPHHPVSLVLTSYLAFAGLVMAFFLTIRRLTNDRFALLATLLIAAHGPLIETTQHPLPVALGLMFGFLGMWLYLRHDQSADSLVSWSLIGAGCALGLCMLSAGPMVFLFLTMPILKLLIDVYFLSGQSRRPTHRLARLGAILILALTALACGCWWNLKLVSDGGLSSLGHWFQSAIEPPSDGPREGTRVALWAWAQQGLLQFSAITGLILLGIHVSIHDLLRVRSARGAAAALLLVCFVSSISGWVLLTLLEPTRTIWLEALRLLTLICGITLATVGFEAIVSRRANSLAVAVIGCVTLLSMQYALMYSASPLFFQRALVLLIGLLVLGLVRTKLPATRAIDDKWLRIALSLLLVLITLAHILAGVSYVQPDSQPITNMYRQLRGVKSVDQCVLITKHDTPQRLKFALRTFTPHSEVAVISGANELRELLVARLQYHRQPRRDQDQNAVQSQPAARLLIAAHGDRRSLDLRMNGVVTERRCEAIPVDGELLYVVVVNIQKIAQ